jgi:hypothetical protein
MTGKTLKGSQAPTSISFPLWSYVVASALLALWLMWRGIWMLPALMLAAPIACLGLVLLLYYVAAPLQARRTFWISPTPEIHAVDLESPETPPSVSEGAYSTAEVLAPQGFIGRGNYYIDNYYSSADSYVGLLEDRASSTIARRVEVALPAGAAVEPYVEFSTVFADGMEIITSNDVRPMLFPTEKSKRIFDFPEVRDPAQLLALHRRAVAEGGVCSVPVPSIESDPARVNLKKIAEGLDYYVRVGYLRLDEASGTYRLTVRGALMVGWKQLWPWGPIRQSLRLARGRRLLRAWEGSHG